MQLQQYLKIQALELANDTQKHQHNKKKYERTAALQQQHMGGVLNDVPLEDARRPNEKQGAYQPATYSEVRMHAFSTNIHH